jgi:hypothetical protein
MNLKHNTFQVADLDPAKLDDLIDWQERQRAGSEGQELFGRRPIILTLTENLVSQGFLERKDLATSKN